MDFSFSYLFSGLVVSSIGGGLFMYGKKAAKPIHLIIGLLMCGYPIFITNLWAMWLLTVALIAPLYVLRRSI